MSFELCVNYLPTDTQIQLIHFALFISLLLRFNACIPTVTYCFYYYSQLNGAYNGNKQISRVIHFSV